MNVSLPLHAGLVQLPSFASWLSAIDYLDQHRHTVNQHVQQYQCSISVTHHLLDNVDWKGRLCYVWSTEPTYLTPHPIYCISPLGVAHYRRGCCRCELTIILGPVYVWYSCFYMTEHAANVCVFEGERRNGWRESSDLWMNGEGGWCYRVRGDMHKHNDTTPLLEKQLIAHITGSSGASCLLARWKSHVYPNSCLKPQPITSLEFLFLYFSEALPQHTYTLVLCVALCLISTCEKPLKQKHTYSQPLFVTRPLPSASIRLLPLPVRWTCCSGQARHTPIVALSNLWLS